MLAECMPLPQEVRAYIGIYQNPYMSSVDWTAVAFWKMHKDGAQVDVVEWFIHQEPEK